jgi:hypothetical protein
MVERESRELNIPISDFDEGLLVRPIMKLTGFLA